MFCRAILLLSIDEGISHYPECCVALVPVLLAGDTPSGSESVTSASSRATI